MRIDQTNVKTRDRFKAMALFLAMVMILAVPARAQQVRKVAAGIWSVSFGEQERFKPTDVKMKGLTAALEKLKTTNRPAIDLSSIRFSQTAKGALAEFVLDSAEQVYGFGLQSNTFQQRGMRRDIRINSWAVGNVGFGHASMPFYISSRGYGLLVNTARYVTFYMGAQNRLERSVKLKSALKQADQSVAESPAALYNKNYGTSNDASIVVEGAKGMEILVFEGPAMREVIERYNLFSGGGSLPPLWALGFKYRAKGDFDAAQVTKMSRYFRDKQIPCDMFGLEPGWQSAIYSCSFSWNPKKFANPDSLLAVMHGAHYKLSLWEHAYVHPSSPVFDSIVPYSGNYAVWKGAVPDFLTPRARQIFGSYHNKNFIRKGISSFKLDECDAAYYTEAQAEWSFPDIAKFPSGADGVQMRQMLGLLYQKTMWDEYRKENKRTMFEVRASHLFAAPYAAALYTDMYDHQDFVRMIVNSGFSGLNWSPELRESRSEADLIRRLQTTLMSAHMVADCWFLKNVPWFQYDKDKNNRDEALPNYFELERKTKKLVELRMSLIPYLYSAFARYYFEGTPVFRALVMDYPDDKRTHTVDDQYMMGENLLCAPFIDGASTREIYFPEGIWYDFNTGSKYTGGKKYTITTSLDEIPLFVKSGTILPLAKPLQFITPDSIFELTCRVYGKPDRGIRLFEDDSFTFNFEKGQYSWTSLKWKNGKLQTQRNGTYGRNIYKIIGWDKVD